MLATVLNSKIAIQINIQIMRAFVQLRKYALIQTEKNKEIEEIKTLLMLHIKDTDKRLSEHDDAIKQIIAVLNNLIEKPRETKQIGFIKQK